MIFKLPNPFRAQRANPLLATTFQAICINILANIIAQYIETRQHFLSSQKISSLTPDHIDVHPGGIGAGFGTGGWGRGSWGKGGLGKEGEFEIDWKRVVQFVIWTCITVPLNFKWQVWLERKLPGMVSEEVEKVERDGKDIEKQSSLPNNPNRKQKRSFKNTALKILCDQGCAAPVNCAMFLVVMTLLKGGTFTDSIATVRVKFWPLKFAGWRIWPAVALFNFTFVPVHRRVIVSTAVGLCWNVFLALFIS